MRTVSLGLMACKVAMGMQMDFATPKPKSDLEWDPKVRVDPNGSASLRTLNKTTGSACLDGSQYGFYIRIGDSKNWTIILDNGPYCVGDKDCADVAQREGSSRSWSETKQCGCKQTDSDGKATNCTCVILPSCDGGLFSGYRHKAHETEDGTQLMMRGSVNLKLTMQTLMNHYGLYYADQVIFYGASTGAAGVLLNIDDLVSTFRSKTQIRGVVNNGYWLNSNNSKGTDSLGYDMTSVFDYHKLNQSVCEGQSSAGECVIGSNLLHNVKTPIFLIQSLYDEWALKHILALDCFKDNTTCSSDEASAATTYGDLFLEDIKSLYKETKAGESNHAYYLTSCICDAEACPWGDNELLTPLIWELLRSWLRADPPTGDDFVKIDRRSSAEAAESDGCRSM